MDSTMQDVELGISDLFEYGRRVHAAAEVLHYRGPGESSRTTFADVASQVDQLAGALAGLGIGQGDVVATLCWNTPEHLAAYFAVPSMGAVLHTLNLRLSDDQIVYIVNHARDQIVIVSGDLLDRLLGLLGRCPEVRDVIVVGGSVRAGDAEVRIHDYDTLLATADAFGPWPSIPERSAAALCYTTGTTGDPKGVAYSHRSVYLHTLAISTGSAYGFSDADRVMPVVPMFHANAWGWPHAAWVAGADLIMTDRFLQAEHLARMISEWRPTAIAAVPTLWSALDAHGIEHGTDFSTLRLAVSSGSALSTGLARDFAAHHGIHLTQGWGMTETSPLLTYSRPPAGVPEGDAETYRTRTGRIVPGVGIRVMDEAGSELPWDGASAGEIELRGVTITGAYVGADPTTSSDRFRDGWLRTGDLGVVHPGGWVELKDRLKDGIKSGGEWISSIELEDVICSHPAVAEAVVIGVPDPRWEERPLACVRLRDGESGTPDDLRQHLRGRVVSWWLPERWAFVSDIPKTSVGKLDKKRVRADYDAGRFEVQWAAGGREVV